VGQDVGVRMAMQTFFRRDVHSAENELAALYEFVRVIPYAYPEINIHKISIPFN
jgi:hypothetical protein